MRTRLYTLRVNNDRSELSFDLTEKIVSESQYELHINLPTGLIFLNKCDYLNKMKVYDDGKVFFIACTKNVSFESAYQCLMQYAVSKLDQRIDKILGMKKKLINEMAAA